jgi:CubicO group peptidase (beta-lactamase class C family)
MSKVHFNGGARFGGLLRIILTGALFMTQPGVACRSIRSDRQANDKRPSDEKRLERLEKQLEDLRQLLRIPGLSAIVVKDQKVLWAKGFGFADLEKRIPATPDTLYHVASLTKTFAATLLMQLVEQKKLDLNEPMSHYSTDFADDSVRIKHLLSHTSQGTPGERYQYSGNRYDYLTAVLEKKTGQSFRELMVQTFLDPLQMSGSVPSHDVVDDANKWSTTLGKDNLDRYRTNLTKLAQPYSLYGDGEIIRAPYPPKGIGAAAGLLSTVFDMAKFDAAIDRHTFLKLETQNIAWTSFNSNAGQPLPHGLGWFVRNYHGLKLIWHYGHWGTGFSATYLKVPDKNLSLILLANTEALSDPFYSTGGIETNALACAFLRLFVFEDLQKGTLSDPQWTPDGDAFARELNRLSKDSKGYDYDCERLSHAAVVKWLGGRRARARQAVKLDPAIYENYVGAYELNPGRTFTVSREGDRLFIDVPRGSKSEMFAESKTKFFLKAPAAQLEFVKDEKGKVTGLEIRANEQKLSAKKLRNN